MPRIPFVKKEEATGEVKEIFDEIEKGFGMVPNIMLAYANHPPLLRANWAKMKAVMMEGSLPKKVKEGIALGVSVDNSCKYCTGHHTHNLSGLGFSEEQINALKQQLDNDGFEAKEQTLIRFCRAINKDANRIPDKMVQEVRDAGYSDAHITEAIGVVELFAGFNRFLDSMQVELEG
eukprot:gb/GECG01012889.1/.p1 GENE.gb/GECG01012889.1/~~gb/GECG01012889.1/.p1  ORF type:complete len:177 (+),score=34.67 gb/GECG01012889.1/:1-531(+)